MLLAEVSFPPSQTASCFGNSKVILCKGRINEENRVTSAAAKHVLLARQSREPDSCGDNSYQCGVGNKHWAQC